MRNKILIPACVIFLFLFSCHLFSQTPSPPLGPPAASDNANGGLLTTILRVALQEAGQQIIDDTNTQLKNHPSIRARLSWGKNSQPLECGYKCMSAPKMGRTEFIDRPNNQRVEHYVRLSFKIDNIKRKVLGKWVPAAGIRRIIRTNINIYAYCEGWQGGAGKIRIYTKTEPPFIDEAHGLVEEILDFILLPLNISNFIDAEIARQLRSPGGLPAIDAPNGDCNSLGVLANYPRDDRSRYDNIVWDRLDSKPIFPGKVTMAGESAEVRFISIKRRKTVNSNTAANEDCRFTFFVNNKVMQYPSVGKVKIAENQTLQFGEKMKLKVPLSKDVPVLQVLFSNNLQAAGWKQYLRKSKYGHGTNTLWTSRKVPAQHTSSPGAGKGSGGKPLKITVNEFELTYTINYRGEAVVKDDPKSKLFKKKQMMKPAGKVKK